FSCANCAGKFEKNVKNLSGVQDAKVNFGASKIEVYGDTTIDELEKAGAFENLKVTTDKPLRQEKKEAKEKKELFYKKHNTLLYASILIVFGYISQIANGVENIITSLLFVAAIVIVVYSLFKVGFQNLLHFEFDIKTLIT